MTLTGSSGVNTLIGGSGDDRIVGNGGADTLIGGSGNDRITYQNDTPGTVISGDATVGPFYGTGNDTLVLNQAATIDLLALTDQDTGSANVRVTSFENVDASGSSGAVVVNAGSGANTLIGGSGNDTLNGGLGADTLTGNGGADHFRFAGGGDDHKPTSISAKAMRSTSPLSDFQFPLEQSRVYLEVRAPTHLGPRAKGFISIRPLTRFFMTPMEAIHLVLRSCSLFSIMLPTSRRPNCISSETIRSTLWVGRSRRCPLLALSRHQFDT